MKAPSLNAGSVKRLVVAIGTTRPVSRSAFLKSRTMLVALGGRGVDRHQVVVVEVDAIGADLGQQVDDLDRRTRRAHRLAEGVAPGVADGPEAEGELIGRGRDKIGLRNWHE